MDGLDGLDGLDFHVQRLTTALFHHVSHRPSRHREENKALPQASALVS